MRDEDEDNQAKRMRKKLL